MAQHITVPLFVGRGEGGGWGRGRGGTPTHLVVSQEDHEREGRAAEKEEALLGAEIAGAALEQQQRNERDQSGLRDRLRHPAPENLNNKKERKKKDQMHENEYQALQR